VNLDFDYFSSLDNLIKLRTIFDHLAPLLHGIHSLAFYHRAIPLIQQYFTAAKLAHVKLLTLLYIDPHFDDDDEDEPFDSATDNEQTVNFCLNWLTSEERDPAEPKFLEVDFCSEVQKFSMAVRQVIRIRKAKISLHSAIPISKTSIHIRHQIRLCEL